MNKSTPALRVLAALGLAASLHASAKTIAYYRFENGTPGQPFGTSGDRGIIDSSTQASHLAAATARCSSQVPLPRIPQTGQPNTRAIQFNGADDVSGALDEGINRVALTDFTIELWARFDTIKGWQTLIGRDDTGMPGEGVGNYALFYLSKSTDRPNSKDPEKNTLRVELVTRENQLLSFNSFATIVTQKWYHIAVVGDMGAGTLTLFLDGAEIGGTSGYTGLLVPKTKTTWTIGRGQYEGKPLDHFFGTLDEVRFSNTALPPRLFLNAESPPPPAPRP